MPFRTKRAAPVKSPCVKICELDDGGLCKGCLRTVEEIRAWTNASELEKLSILAEVKRRRKVGV